MNPAMRRAALASGVAACICSVATAQGSITVVDTGTAAAISADGTTIVGFSTEPTVWVIGGSTTLIGETDAVDVSGDGSVVWGQMTDPGTGLSSAGYYTGGTWTSVGNMSGTGCPDLSNAYALSDDGMVGVGLGWDGCDAFAMKWTPGTGVTMLPQLGPNSARANAVSGDGSTIGGWDEAATGPRRASIWLPSGEILPLEGTAGNDEGLGETWGLSTDGSFACGQAFEPWVWSKSGGATYVGLPGPLDIFDVAILEAISDDGKIAVGTQGGGFFGTPFRATIWTQGGGIRWLDEYLVELGIVIPDGLVLAVAVDMTPDGSRIVGYGGELFAPTSVWYVDLDNPECFLVIGDGPGETVFNTEDHTFYPQLSNVVDAYPTLMSMLPELPVNLANGPTSPFGAGVLGNYADPSGVTQYFAQIMMWSPQGAPWEPEQWSQGVRVVVLGDGSLFTRYWGHTTGIRFHPELGTNNQGQPVLRFPFQIPGF